MNLLPNTEKQTLKKGFKLRFVVVALFLLSASFLVGFIMLAPSYLLTLGYFSKASSENYPPDPKNENLMKEILNLPAEINSKLKFFQSKIGDRSAGESLSVIVNYLPRKVTINSISFSKDQTYKDKKGSVILVSGVALDRESLVSFSTSLKESELFSSVDVPVSSLTKDRNLPFFMNIFIENQK